MYPFEEPGQPPLILWLQACPPLRGPDLVAAGCHASMTQDQAKDTTPITKSIFPGFSRFSSTKLSLDLILGGWSVRKLFLRPVHP